METSLSQLPQTPVGIDCSSQRALPAMREVTVFRDPDHRAIGDTIFAESLSRMRAPYGLNILDNCLTCPMREEHYSAICRWPRCSA